MGKNQQVEAPLAYYRELYLKSEAREIEARTGLRFDAAAGCFGVTLVGKQYYVKHPEFSVSPSLSPYEEILLLRFLLEGRFAPGTGRMLAYEELPQGAVYMAQFQGRNIGRFAREFGRDPGRLKAALEAIPGLNYEAVSGADVGYRLEFLDGLFISILLWEADEEFPASAQLLFSDNFKYAFTAEDVAVVGDVLIGRLKAALK